VTSYQLILNPAAASLPEMRGTSDADVYYTSSRW